jgi:hypothetical protein
MADFDLYITGNLSSYTRQAPQNDPLFLTSKVTFFSNLSTETTMKLSPTKKQMKASSDEWQARRKHIKRREVKKRVAKAERDGGKRN